MAAPGVSKTVIVVTGGDPVESAQVPADLAGAVVIAADSGVDQALALGLHVDRAIGDFDSVTADALATVTARGAIVDRHPVAKDATDLALALDAALALEPTRIVVLGGHGGRLDHLLANALLLAGPAYAATSIVAQMGAARVTVVRGRVELTGPVGDVVSLLPAHGVAIGVTTTGLLYPLAGEDLPAGSTRGVSNELTAPTATVEVRNGVLLAVQPGSLGAHHQMRTS